MSVSIKSSYHSSLCDDRSYATEKIDCLPITLPFPFDEAPNLRKYQPPIAETYNDHIKEKLILRRNIAKIVKPEEEDDDEIDSGRLMSSHSIKLSKRSQLNRTQINEVIKFIQSCCVEHADNQEISLIELEAAFRKHKRAVYSAHEEEYARGLMVSLDFLLDENGLTPNEWFKQTDVRGAVGGDGKLTYPELQEGIDALCNRIQVPLWDETDINTLLKYMDQSGDGDLTATEVRLSFKRSYMPSQTKDIINSAGPLIAKLENFMKKKRIRIKDLFRKIDTDKSNLISMEELSAALIHMFSENSDALQVSNKGSDVKNFYSGWAKYHRMEVTDKSKKAVPDHVRRAKSKKLLIKAQEDSMWSTFRTIDSEASESTQEESPSNLPLLLRRKLQMRAKLAPIPLEESSCSSASSNSFMRSKLSPPRPFSRQSTAKSSFTVRQPSTNSSPLLAKKTSVVDLCKQKHAMELQELCHHGGGGGKNAAALGSSGQLMNMNMMMLHNNHHHLDALSSAGAAGEVHYADNINMKEKPSYKAYLLKKAQCYDDRHSHFDHKIGLWKLKLSKI